MPPRKKSQEPAQLPPQVVLANSKLFHEQPTPALDHNSNVSDDALIAENFKIENMLKAAAAKLNDWAAPHKARLKEIEDTLFARLAERKADSTKTDSGTAYISNIMNTKIENREAIIDFMMDNWEAWGADMIQVNVTKDAVKRYLDENDGQLPPGLSISHFSRLNIRRS
jgi:hypothetical protein